MDTTWWAVTSVISVNKLAEEIGVRAMSLKNSDLTCVLRDVSHIPNNYFFHPLTSSSLNLFHTEIFDSWPWPMCLYPSVHSQSSLNYLLVQSSSRSWSCAVTKYSKYDCVCVVRKAAPFQCGRQEEHDPSSHLTSDKQERIIKWNTNHHHYHQPLKMSWHHSNDV